MNPNSAHQLVSKWTVTVRPPHGHQMDLETLKANVARFCRKGFGSGGQVRLTYTRRLLRVELLVDSQRHPHDQADFTYFARAFRQFFEHGFGVGTQVQVDATLLAGERLDGRPPDQLIILPPVAAPRPLEGVH